MRFDSFVACWIGEPITALGFGNEYLVLGSISGYLAMVSLKTNSVTFTSSCHTELVRVIFVSNSTIYACIGDDYIAKHDINDFSNYSVIHYEEFRHNEFLCSNYIPYINYSNINKDIRVLLALYPTNETDRLCNLISIRKYYINLTSNYFKNIVSKWNANIYLKTI